MKGLHDEYEYISSQGIIFEQFFWERNGKYFVKEIKQTILRIKNRNKCNV